MNDQRPDTPKRKCMSCRRDYEHTYPWARPIKLCRRCADAYMMAHAAGQRAFQQEKGQTPTSTP